MRKRARPLRRVLKTLTESNGKAAQPFLAAALVKILEATGDKSKAVKDAAVDTSKAVLKILSPCVLEALMPALLAGLSVKAKPLQKEATLLIIAEFAISIKKSIYTPNMFLYNNLFFRLT